MEVGEWKDDVPKEVVGVKIGEMKDGGGVKNISQCCFHSWALSTFWLFFSESDWKRHSEIPQTSGSVSFIKPLKAPGCLQSYLPVSLFVPQIDFKDQLRNQQEGGETRPVFQEVGSLFYCHQKFPSFSFKSFECVIMTNNRACGHKHYLTTLQCVENILKSKVQVIVTWQRMWEFFSAECVFLLVFQTNDQISGTRWVTLTQCEVILLPLTEGNPPAFQMYSWSTRDILYEHLVFSSHWHVMHSSDCPAGAEVWCLFYCRGFSDINRHLF